MAAHTMTFRVTREETLDTHTIVWGADPVDASISTGVTGRTLAELHEEAEAAAWFILDVPKDTTIDVRYVYDFDERVAADLDAYQRARRCLGHGRVQTTKSTSSNTPAETYAEPRHHPDDAGTTRYDLP
jgi:hypothetical protein